MPRILFLICLIVASFACTKTPTKYELSREERKVVDSTFRVRMNILQAEVDSICALERKNNTQRIKDSLIKVRREEIENVMNQ